MAQTQEVLRNQFCKWGNRLRRAVTGPRSHCKSEVAYEASDFPSPAALTPGLKLWPKET